MKVRSPTFDFLLLNLGVLFISTSGVLGRTIDLPIPITIASRAAIAALVLRLFLKGRFRLTEIRPKDHARLWWAGILLGAHWILYFYALRFSNVAIGMLSLFTYPIITALIEPIWFRSKMAIRHLLLGGMILMGIYFLIPEFNFENQFFIAVLLGVLSALCYSIRNIVVKSMIETHRESQLMTYQLGVITLVLMPTFFLLNTSKLLQFIPHLFVLAVLTTAVGHTLFLYGFRHFSVTSASIISGLQPVYGILLGVLLIGEFPHLPTLLGGAIIILAAVIEGSRIMQVNE